MNYDKEITPSEGEIYIECFLLENGIKYDAEVKVFGLKNDFKPNGKLYEHRRLDFYLPEYDVFIEYFGLYHVNDKYKQEADQKKRVYDDNELKCIYFYSENLGNIKYHFEYRLQAILEKREIYKDKLFWFKVGKIIDKSTPLFLAMLLLIFPLFPYQTWAFLFLLFFVFGGVSTFVYAKRIFGKPQRRVPPFKEIHLN